MPYTIAKNFNLCFPKTQQPSSTHNDHNSLFSPNTTTPPSTLIKNFNSLYDSTFDSTTTTPPNDLLSLASSSEAEYSTNPDLKTAFASHRFFCSAPGLSSSIIDSSPLIAPLTTAKQVTKSNNVVGDRIAIPTFSPDPYMDFRRSMQEMVEARQLKDVRANWDDLHELLLCFLALNPKCTHKFIFGAFADLLVSLMKSFPDEHGIRRNLSSFRSDRLL